MMNVSLQIANVFSVRLIFQVLNENSLFVLLCCDFLFISLTRNSMWSFSFLLTNSEFTIHEQRLRFMNFLCANDLNKHLISSVFFTLNFLPFIHSVVRNLRVKEMNIKVAKLCNHFAILFSVWVLKVKKPIHFIKISIKNGKFICGAIKFLLILAWNSRTKFAYGFKCWCVS